MLPYMLVLMLSAAFNSRTSFFKVISHFGPFIHAVIAHRHRKCDLQFTTEAARVIAMHATDSAGVEKLRTKLNVQLKLETALCSEYWYIFYKLNHNRKLMNTLKAICILPLSISLEGTFFSSRVTLTISVMVFSKPMQQHWMI